VALLVLLLCVAANSLKEQQTPAFGIAKANRRQVSPFAFFDFAIFHGDTRRESGTEERRRRANRPMTVDAANLNGRARFVVENAITVRVLPEMTIDAVHAFL